MEENQSEKIKKPAEGKKKDLVLPIAIVLAALIIGGAMVYSKGLSTIESADSALNTQNSNSVKLDIASDQVFLGKADAPITIFEFGDYQCPYCKRFHMLAHLDLVKDYVDSGLAKIVFMDFPLPGHDFAQKASEAAWCAKDQNKFWEMHDVLFENSGTTNGLTIDNMIKYAEDLGMDKQMFEECLNSSKYAARVQQILEMSARLGIQATPTTIITNKPLPLVIDTKAVAVAYQGTSGTANLGDSFLIIGAQPYSTIKSVIDSLVK